MKAKGINVRLGTEFIRKVERFACSWAKKTGEERDNRAGVGRIGCNSLLMSVEWRVVDAVR